MPCIFPWSLPVVTALFAVLGLLSLLLLLLDLRRDCCASPPHPHTLSHTLAVARHHKRRRGHRRHPSHQLRSCVALCFSDSVQNLRWIAVLYSLVGFTFFVSLNEDIFCGPQWAVPTWITIFQTFTYALQRVMMGSVTFLWMRLTKSLLMMRNPVAGRWMFGFTMFIMLSLIVSDIICVALCFQSVFIPGTCNGDVGLLWSQVLFLLVSCAFVFILLWKQNSRTGAHRRLKQPARRALLKATVVFVSWIIATSVVGVSFFVTSPWTILSELLFAELIPFFVLISVFHRKSVNRTLVRNTNDVYESKAPPSTQLLEVTPLTDENPTSPTSEEDGLEPLSGVEQLRGGSSVQWGPLTGRSVSFSHRGADGVGEDSMTATRCSSSSGLADALFPGSRASTAQRRVAASSLYQNSFTVLGGDVWEAAPDAEDSNPLYRYLLDGRMGASEGDLSSARTSSPSSAGGAVADSSWHHPLPRPDMTVLSDVNRDAIPGVMKPPAAPPQGRRLGVGSGTPHLRRDEDEVEDEHDVSSDNSALDTSHGSLVRVFHLDEQEDDRVSD